MAPPLACFDLDNTLIDRQRAFHAWALSFVAARGLGDEALALLVALDRDGFATRTEVFAPARAALGLPETVEELIAAYRVEYPRHIVAVPAVAAALDRLRAAGCAVALVTNGPPSQSEKIARAGLAGSFDAVCISELLGVAKPEPAIFSLAAERCGTSLSAVAGSGVMVGDSPDADVAGGKAAGLRTVWVRRGREWPAAAPAPDLVVEDGEEAIAQLLAGALDR